MGGAALAMASCRINGSSTREPSQASFMHGLTLVAGTADDFRPSRIQAVIESVKSTGADWIAVAPSWSQGTHRSTKIRPDPARTPPDEDVLSLIEKAHEAGVNVLLSPFVESRDRVWRSDFDPKDLSAWFAEYSTMALHYAELGQHAKVGMFSVGSELDFSEEAYLDEWRVLIGKVRRSYEGSLTYAASHASPPRGGGYKRTPFWSELDCIGIDAYFPMAARLISPSQLAATWEMWLGEIERWYAASGLKQPIIFTGLGYRSVVGAAVQPSPRNWDYEGPVDTGVQANLYTAFFGIPYRREILRGVFWWHWEPSETPGADDTSYVPNGKPAEDVLRRGYAAAIRRPTYPGSG